MSLPSSEALFSVAVDYLEKELLPTLDGEHRFKTRVALNALRIAQREENALRAASMSLKTTTPNEPPGSGSGSASGSGASEDDLQLCERIRAGEIATDDPALRAYLRRSLQQALAINNPKWLARA